MFATTKAYSGLAVSDLHKPERSTARRWGSRHPTSTA